MTTLGKSLMRTPVLVLGVCVGLSSCARAQTRIVEMPRVDQELSGNRGVIQGQVPSASAAAPKTRQVIMTDVELMTGKEMSRGWKRSWKPVKGQVSANGRYVAPENAPAAAAQGTSPKIIAETTEPISQTYARTPVTLQAPAYQPPAVEEAESDLPAIQPVAPAADEAAPAKTYTVQKGDTLEKIAQKFYGSSRRWPKIYKANKDTLKNPNRLHVGQTLTIPTLASEPTQRASASDTIK